MRTGAGGGRPEEPGEPAGHRCSGPRPPSSSRTPPASGERTRGLSRKAPAPSSAQEGVLGEQPLHLGAEAGVPLAGGVQQGAPPVRRQVGRLVEKCLEAVVHGAIPLN